MILGIACSDEPASTPTSDVGLDIEPDLVVQDASDATLPNDVFENDVNGEADSGRVSRISDLSVGLMHTCVLQHTGELSCFGEGDDGRLGYGDTEDVGVTNLPSDKGFVPTGDLQLQQVEAGEGNTCALTDDGEVYCWGWGNHGRNGNVSDETLGDDEVPADLSPIDLGDVPVTQIDVSAGVRELTSFDRPNSSVVGHACALRQDGTVYCWGENNSGQLGYGNTENVGDDETPASVGPVNVGGVVTQVATGSRHTCVLLEGGAVKCWGGFSGLGYGNLDRIGDDEVPADVGTLNLGPGVVTQISAGARHMCAVFEDGSLICWGDWSRGALGYGNLESSGDDEEPATFGRVDVGGPVVAVSTGTNLTCVLDGQGRIKCWGENLYGQSGTGTTEERLGDDEQPSEIDWIETGAGPALEVSAGRVHACAMFADSRVKCWGQGQWIGQGAVSPNIGDDETPADVGFVDLIP